MAEGVLALPLLAEVVWLYSVDLGLSPNGMELRPKGSAPVFSLASWQSKALRHELTERGYPAKMGGLSPRSATQVRAKQEMHPHEH